MGLALAIASTWWVDQPRITIVSAGPYLLVLTAAYFACQHALKGVATSK